MKARFNAAVIQFRFLFCIPEIFVPLAFDSPSPKPQILKLCRYWTTFATTTAPSPLGETLDGKVAIQEVESFPKDSIDVLRRWGCSDVDILQIFHRRPALRKVGLANLQSKLKLLSALGLNCSGLVKVINCRPHLFSCRINRCFDERLEFLLELFGSREVVVKAITRNPSLLTYDFHNKMKPVIATYNELGVSRKDLIPMLLSRPTLIPRTSLNDGKLDYIRKTGISKNSKMYKYVVILIAILRIETICEKLANFEKFGFSEDEVFGLFGCSPLILTLSIDKVQRNMTFILGTMKLPTSVVLGHPFLLFYNLEAVLKPRVLLARKIQDMALIPQLKGPTMLRALRMKEKQFVKAFVNCHPKDVAYELMKFYSNAKDVKRLAEASKTNVHKRLTSIKDSRSEHFWIPGLAVQNYFFQFSRNRILFNNNLVSFILCWMPFSLSIPSCWK